MKPIKPISNARTRLIAGLGSLTFSVAAFAAAPSAAWWVDIVNDREAAVRQQLAQGVDPNAMSSEDLPALMLAIRSEAWKVYDALLADPRTQVEVENAHGETPLMYLALLGETDRAVALIERGAKVNRLGWTPLHYAASKGQVETARMLLKRGAIVNAPAPDGTSPLMMAAYSGNRDVVQVLLDHGADPSAINLQKLTAADWARERRHGRLANELDELTARARAGRAVDAPTPAASPSSTPADAGAAAPAAGGSRYFDLDRFERED